MSAKSERIRVVLCMLVHFTCILTRLNLSINLTEIINSGYLNEFTATVVLNAGLLGFGCGQLISGIAADRFNPSKIILSGLFVTAFTNVLFIMPFSLTKRIIIWFINCFACSFLWPPLIKFMSQIFTEIEYKRHSFFISLGSSLGSVTLYLVSPLLITLFNFSAVFIFTGSFTLILGITWMLNNLKTPLTSQTFNKEAKTFLFSKNSIVIFLIFIVAMILHGGIRDYIISWFPYYLYSSFNLKSENSILVCIMFPLISILCNKSILTINKRAIRNEISCVSTLFFLSSLFLILLCITKSQYLSIVFAGLSAGFADSVNFFMTCLVPTYFKKVGRVSSIAGFLNTFTYLGVPLFSLFGVSLINSENFGLLFAVISLLGLIGAATTSFGIKMFKEIKSNC